jgi:ADP-ribose pyrophosphatase YjhB (NUDIX family)
MEDFKQVISCGIVPIRRFNGKFQILLGQPIESGFYGLGFLKGQVEENETNFEAAIREFAEESGNLDVEVFSEDIVFIQDNPRKKIFIWPAKILETKNNINKINDFGVITEHDAENEFVQFFNIDELPMVFRNQQDILDELLVFIENNKNLID